MFWNLLSQCLLGGFSVGPTPWDTMSSLDLIVWDTSTSFVWFPKVSYNKMTVFKVKKCSFTCSRFHSIFDNPKNTLMNHVHVLLHAHIYPISLSIIIFVMSCRFKEFLKSWPLRCLWTHKHTHDNTLTNFSNAGCHYKTGHIRRLLPQ